MGKILDAEHCQPLILPKVRSKLAVDLRRQTASYLAGAECPTKAPGQQATPRSRYPTSQQATA